MKWSQCLRRELLWWWRSPSLWWCMPLLLLAIALQPHFLWWSSGAKVIEIEGVWRYLGMAWKMSGKEMVRSNTLLMMSLGGHFAEIDRLMGLPVEEIWKLYIVPPLQIFMIFPLSILVPPIAVTVFRRDIDHGAYKAFRLNGGSLWTFLSAKLFVQGLVLAPMQLGAMILVLHLHSLGSGHAKFFEFTDPMWLCCTWIGWGLGLWSVMISWLMCLISHNGSTEIYTSMIASSISGMLCILIVKMWGWNIDTIVSLSVVIWLCVPILLFCLIMRMRTASYLFR